MAKTKLDEIRSILIALDIALDGFCVENKEGFKTLVSKYPEIRKVLDIDLSVVFQDKEYLSVEEISSRISEVSEKHGVDFKTESYYGFVFFHFDTFVLSFTVRDPTKRTLVITGSGDVGLMDDLNDCIPW